MHYKRGAGNVEPRDLRLASKAFLVGWTSARGILSGIESPPKGGLIGIFLKMIAEEVGTAEVTRRAEIITDLLQEAHGEIEEGKTGEGDGEKEGEHRPGSLTKSLRIEDRARGYERWVRRAASTLEGYDVDARWSGEDALLGRLRPGKVGALPSEAARYYADYEAMEGQMEDPYELAHEVILALYKAAGRGRWYFEVKLEGWRPELEEAELEDETDGSSPPAKLPLPPELGVAVYGRPDEEGYDHLTFENLFTLADFACSDENALRALQARIVSDVPGGFLDPEKRMHLAGQATMILESVLEQMDHPQSVPPGMPALAQLAEALDMEEESDDVRDAIEALLFDLEHIAAGEEGSAEEEGEWEDEEDG